MPPWKRKASVVVPCAILIGHDGLERSSEAARSQAEGCQQVPISSHSPQRGGKSGSTNVGYWRHGKLERETGNGIEKVLLLLL